MNRKDAKLLADGKISELELKPYATFLDKIGTVDTLSVDSSDGGSYNIEIQYFWDNKPNESIRILVSVDYGGWSTIFPVSSSTVITNKN